MMLLTNKRTRRLNRGSVRMNSARWFPVYQHVSARLPASLCQLPGDENLANSCAVTQNWKCQKSPLLHQRIPFILFSMAPHAAHDHCSHKGMKCEIRGLLELSSFHHLPLSLSLSLLLPECVSLCPCRLWRLTPSISVKPSTSQGLPPQLCC